MNDRFTARPEDRSPSASGPSSGNLSTSSDPRPGRRWPPTGRYASWLILREKVRAFRADPEVASALQAARVDELAQPTLADGEGWREVRDERPDVEALAARGMAYERLDQLALEHLYGIR